MRILGAVLVFAVAPFAFGQRGPTVVMPAPEVLEGITFDTVKNAVFLPIDEITEHFAVQADWDPKAKSYEIADKKLKRADVRTLFDGTPVVNIFALKGKGFTVKELENGEIELDSGTHFGTVTVPGQWVEVNLAAQRLRGYQGERLIMDTKVSTGKRGNTTPSGTFKTGPEKSKYRTSSKYENAPMPFSVQFYGGYFIHGSSSVPSRPASHGCVRMPLTGSNAAKYFFEWVSLKVPVTLGYEWSERAAAIENAMTAESPKS